MRSGILSASVSGKETLCNTRVYEHGRYYLYADGKLVFLALLCSDRYSVRGDPVEGLFGKKSEANYGDMDAFQSFI